MAPRLSVSLAFLVACHGGDDSETNAPNDTSIDTESLTPHLEGALAKGPFLLGSTVIVSPVTGAGEPTGSQFSTQTTDDLGRFSVDLTNTGPISIEGAGFYYDEVGQSLSVAPITLRAYADLTANGEQAAYLNVLTHLAYNRTKNLLHGGATPEDARNSAEDALRAGLGIGPEDFDPGEANALNLLGGDTDANAYLLSVSAVLLQVAHEDAGPDGPVDAKLQQLLNTISSDLADDGKIDDTTRDRLHRTSLKLDTDATEAGLQAWFDSLGSSTVVPDLRRVLVDYDQDDDGALGGCDVVDLCVDCDDHDATTTGAVGWVPDADNDGFGDMDGTPDVTCTPDAGWVTDLTDCDDDDEFVFPGADEVCNGLDDNCDDVVDTDAIDPSTWVMDVDQDGYDVGKDVVDCFGPVGSIDQTKSLGTDCDDANKAVHPGATEIYYDNIDEACDQGDDFDQDGDKRTFPTDCKDTDPAVFPGAPEKLTDALDSDCDGGTDTSAYAVYAGVRGPAGVTVSVTASNIYVTAGVERNAGGSTPANLEFTFGASDAPGDKHDVGTFAVSNGNVGSIVADGEAIPHGYLEVIGVVETGSPLVLVSEAHLQDTTKSSFGFTLRKDDMALADAPRDTEVRTDADGNLWIVTCTGHVLEYAVLDPTSKYASIADSCLSDQPTNKTCDHDGDNDGTLDPPWGPDATPYAYLQSVGSCTVDPPTTKGETAATITVCDGKLCEQLVADRSTSRLYRSPTQTAPVRGTSEAHGAWRTSIDAFTGGLSATNGAQTWSLLPGKRVSSADLYGDANRVFLAAIVADQNADGLNDLLVAVGDPDLPLTTYLQPMGRYVPVSVSVARGPTSDWVAVGLIDSVPDPVPSDANYVDSLAWTAFLR